MIIDLKEKTRIVDNFLVESVSLKKARTGRDFLDFTLKDRSGKVNAKLWEVSEENREAFKAGDAVRIEGDVGSFNNTLQIRIVRIKTVSLEKKDMDKLVESAPVDEGRMFDFIVDTIADIKDGDIRRITGAVLKKYEKRFRKYPAAKAMHHAFKGGLLYHTYTMLVNAKKLAETYTFLNTDLLFAGVIIHDVCKTDEMAVNSSGAVESYTPEGLLLGHISMCVCTIDEVSRDLNIDNEIPLLLKHMVLSHHYEPEYGSPVKPMFPEAEMLHYLDLIDAKMNQMLTAMRSTKPNEMSGRMRMLDGRNIYNHNMGQLKEDL